MARNDTVKKLDLHYNFISYPKNWYYPYSSNKDLPNHNEKDQEAFKNSGYIEYTINTKSKLTTDFRKNKAGDIFISGSEIRGKIRSNLEILSFSYPEFVEDKKILYRGFASDNDKIKREYNKALGINKKSKSNRITKINEVVKAGYLQKIGNKYFICPAEEICNKNFLTIEESKLIDRYKGLTLKTNERMYYNWKRKIKNRNFIPFEKDVTYSINENCSIREIRNPDGNHKGEVLEKGVLYCSTNVGEKKRHYLIGKKEQRGEVVINDELISSYNDNFKKFKLNKKGADKTKGFYNIFNCEDSSKEKIVFYLTDDKNRVISIARTPYMKISYKNTIKKIIDQKEPTDGNNKKHISYADAIFGFTGKGEDGKQAYKSRLRFTKAIVTGNILDDRENFFLPQPQPSAFGMYLEQDGVECTEDIISYANHISKINLRGYKFYKIRKEVKKLKVSRDHENMIVTKKVLDKNSDVNGKIYFNNLSDEELGLLIISLDISLLDVDSNEYYDLIGGAKAYGYGKYKLDIGNVYLEKRNNILDFEDRGYRACTDYSTFVKSYKDKMSKLLEENKRTIEEYKVSKKIVKDIAKEHHYLDYVNGQKGEKKISAYKKNQLLKPLIRNMRNSTSEDMSSDSMAKIFSTKFKVR